MLDRDRRIPSGKRTHAKRRPRPLAALVCALRISIFLPTKNVANRQFSRCSDVKNAFLAKKCDFCFLCIFCFFSSYFLCIFAHFYITLRVFSSFFSISSCFFLVFFNFFPDFPHKIQRIFAIPGLLLLIFAPNLLHFWHQMQAGSNENRGNCVVSFRISGIFRAFSRFFS